MVANFDLNYLSYFLINFQNSCAYQGRSSSVCAPEPEKMTKTKSRLTYGTPCNYKSRFRSFPQGDIISWDKEPWRLRSPWNRSKSEMLSLERDVCAFMDTGYFMVPQAVSFEESFHMCKKVSGTPISFANKTDFLSIVHYLSKASNMRTPGCVELVEDGSTQVEVWGGGSDADREGTWTTWDTQQEIEVRSEASSQK